MRKIINENNERDTDEALLRIEMLIGWDDCSDRDRRDGLIADIVKRTIYMRERALNYNAREDKGR